MLGKAYDVLRSMGQSGAIAIAIAMIALRIRIRNYSQL